MSRYFTKSLNPPLNWNDSSSINPVVLTSEQIMGLLPHRYPFALVDRDIEHEPGKKAVAIKDSSSTAGLFLDMINKHTMEELQKIHLPTNHLLGPIIAAQCG